MPAIELSGHELDLLKVAVPYMKEVEETEGRIATQEELRKKLGCREASARRIQNYIIEANTLKLAERLDKTSERGENRAVAQFAAGQDLSVETHLLRENANLKRALVKKKHEAKSQVGQLREEVLAEIEELKELAKKNIKGSVSKTPKPLKLTGNMLEVNLPDAHFGKLSWPAETGGAPYDSKIAQVTYGQAIDALIARTNHLTYDTVLYVIGNDILNANNSESETAHGTVVDSDGRYQKTFWKVRNTVIETIEKLLKIAPVTVMAVYGNHDQLSSWHLADSVECYFHNNKDVTVHNDPVYRKYYEFGKNMILFTHGDKGKKNDYPLLMATEQPAMFGRTKFREAHCGHTHETKTQETHGVRVRVLPALCPADAWHSENGYVGNLRNAEAYMWNKEEGLIGTAIYNVDSQEEVRTKRELV